jgi:hypothetical protein
MPAAPVIGVASRRGGDRRELMRTGSQSAEIAAGVYCLRKGPAKSNIYLVRSGSSWVLIDTARGRTRAS